MSSEESRQRTITITIDEVDDRTRAIARMDWRDRKLVGVGHTRLGELFPDRASERLAVSRALSDLIAHLHTCVGDDVAGGSRPLSMH